MTNPEIEPPLGRFDANGVEPKIGMNSRPWAHWGDDKRILN